MCRSASGPAFRRAEHSGAHARECPLWNGCGYTRNRWRLYSPRVAVPGNVESGYASRGVGLFGLGSLWQSGLASCGAFATCRRSGFAEDEDMVQ